MVSQIEQF